MANPDSPFGFKVYHHGSGGTAGRTNEYPLTAAYGTALFEGDPVVSDGAGNVNVAGAAAAVLGIFAGVRWQGTDGSYHYSNNWVAGTTTKTGTFAQALVYDDPATLFYAQVDTIAAANIGLLYDSAIGTGSAVTGKSDASLEAGTNAQWKVVKIILDKPIRNAAGDQAMLAAGANAQIVVKAAVHELGSAPAVSV